MGMDHAAAAAAAPQDVRDAGKLEQALSHAVGQTDTALGKLQESADIFKGDAHGASGKPGLAIENHPGNSKNIFLPNHPLDAGAPPTDKERGDADKALDRGLTKMASPEATKSMEAINAAITSGDSKALGEAIKNADPAKLRDMLSEINRGLTDKGASTRLDMTEDGKVLVSDSNSSTAISIDPKTGEVGAKEVEHNADGSMLVKPGEVLHADTDKAFKEISDRTVNAINGKFDFGDILRNVERPHITFPDLENFRNIQPGRSSEGGGAGSGRAVPGDSYPGDPFPKILHFKPLKEQ